MIDRMGNYILDNLIYKDEVITGDQREVMLFGIVRILEDIPKFVAIFIISYILGILQYVGIVVAITLLYKVLIGGAHARTNIECFLYTSFYFISPVLISKYLPMNHLVLYITYAVVALFSYYIVIKHAPADTEEIPILNKKKRKTLQILALCSITLIISISLLFIKNMLIQQIIVITVFYIDFFATNIMYRILRCKHSYESEEFKEYFNQDI